MTAKHVKQALLSSIQTLTDRKQAFSRNPQKDNTRNRKLPFEKTISAVLAFRGGTLTHDLLDFFGLEPSMPTSSAFVQQRAKILPEAFEFLFHDFTANMNKGMTYRGLQLLAVDGSDLRIAANPSDSDSFFPGTNGQKPYNLLHINTMYDLLQNIYLDAILQKRKNWNESKALTDMVDRSDVQKALLLADRGYEAYNNLAHIQEKGWYFLFRIKDNSNGIASTLDLPDSGEYDIPFHLNLTKSRKYRAKHLTNGKSQYKCLPASSRFDYLPQTPDRYDPDVFYSLHFRIVRFPLSDTSFETIITNLDAEDFPAAEIKRLYALRWGIETSFRNLKHTLALLHLHAKKVEFVYQEIFAKLTIHNFCQMIAQSVSIQQADKKYAYKVNFSDAAHVCLQFFLGKIRPPDVEALLTKFISPIRPGRKRSRRLSLKPSVSFTYRVA